MRPWRPPPHLPRRARQAWCPPCTPCPPTPPAHLLLDHHAALNAHTPRLLLDHHAALNAHTHRRLLLPLPLPHHAELLPPGCVGSSQWLHQAARQGVHGRSSPLCIQRHPTPSCCTQQSNSHLAAMSVMNLRSTPQCSTVLEATSLSSRSSYLPGLLSRCLPGCLRGQPRTRPRHSRCHSRCHRRHCSRRAPLAVHHLPWAHSGAMELLVQRGKGCYTSAGARKQVCIPRQRPPLPLLLQPMDHPR